jgi:hypothetical protein
VEDTIKKGVGPQLALASRESGVRSCKGRQVECSGGVNHRDAGEKNLTQPWVHVMSGEDFV